MRWWSPPSREATARIARGRSPLASASACGRACGAWGCLRSTRRLRDAKGDDDRTKADLIAIDEPTRHLHSVRPHVRSVLALQILHRRFALSNNETGVLT